MELKRFCGLCFFQSKKGKATAKKVVEGDVNQQSSAEEYHDLDVASELRLNGNEVPTEPELIYLKGDTAAKIDILSKNS